MLYLAIVAMVLGGPPEQSASPQLAPRPLRASTIKKLEAPAFGVFGQTQCDDSLAMYDHLASGSYNQTTILRTGLSGTESTVYKLPAEFADATAFTDFFATSDGKVIVLVEDQQGHSVRFDFDSDGNVSSHAQLEMSEQVAGDKIAVFLNGMMLFSGHYRRTASPDLAGKRYLALFQPSGKLLRQLNTGDMGSIDLNPPAHRIAEGAVTVGKDGFAYFLIPDRVYVISSSGQIERKIPFEKPASEFSAVHLQYSEGLLVISFVKAGKPEAVFQYLVVNALTGEPVGLYEPSEETGNNNVCFSRRDGFLFLTIKNDRVNLITAPLR
jgi:hypothetical protein